MENKTASLTISKLANSDLIKVNIKNNGHEVARIEIDKSDFTNALFGLAEAPAKILKNRN